MHTFIRSLLSALPLVALTLTLTSTVVVAEDYYKWVDEHGVTHYGQRAPKNTKTSKGTTQTGHSEPSIYTAPKKDEVSETAEEEQQSLKDPMRCKAAKSNLETIKTSSRIKVKGEDGEFSYLSQDEIAKRKQEAQKAVDESC